jgi:predicted kinase
MAIMTANLPELDTPWLSAPKATLRMVMLIGPPGVGKTTVAESLSRQCPLQNVVLDGDSLAHTWPGGMDRKRLDLIERNLLHCAEGYRIWGAQYCFCSWVVAHQQRLDMLGRRMRAKGIHLRVIALDAPVGILVDRMMARPQPRFAPTDENIDYLSSLSKRIRNLHHCELVDTTGKHFSSVANDIAERIKEKSFWTH